VLVKEGDLGGPQGENDHVRQHGHGHAGAGGAAGPGFQADHRQEDAPEHGQVDGAGQAGPRIRNRQVQHQVVQRQHVQVFRRQAAVRGHDLQRRQRHCQQARHAGPHRKAEPFAIADRRAERLARQQVIHGRDGCHEQGAEHGAQSGAPHHRGRRHEARHRLPHFRLGVWLARQHVLDQPGKIDGRDPPIHDGHAQQDRQEQGKPGVRLFLQARKGGRGLEEDVADVEKGLRGHADSIVRGNERAAGWLHDVVENESISFLYGKYSPIVTLVFCCKVAHAYISGALTGARPGRALPAIIFR
jgi:hypothetical protein